MRSGRLTPRFAKRLPDLVQPWARVSNRLLEECKAIGLSASAEVSERLAPRLGMQVKAVPGVDTTAALLIQSTREPW